MLNCSVVCLTLGNPMDRSLPDLTVHGISQAKILESLVAQTVKRLSACNVGDPSLIPGLGRSPGEGNGNPLQYSCLENSVD